jgi:ABC-type sugar transport system ATPase subunit
VTITAESGGAGASGAADQPLLSLHGITKNFGAVQALSGVDFDIMPGKITALVGDNGAGKSTLIKTISGIWEPTAGEITWKGQPVSMHTPRDADSLGIATVYQDLALCDNLDIVQNMFLGHELLHYRLLDEGSMEITGAGHAQGALGHHHPRPSASPWPRSRAASASRWRWPRP